MILKVKVLAVAVLLASGCSPAPRPPVPERERIALALTGIEARLVSDVSFLTVPATIRLQDALVSCGRFRVVERAEIERIIGEHPPDRHSRIGKLLGADWIVHGAILEAVLSGGERQIAEVVVHLRVVRVEDGVILYSNSFRGSADGDASARRETLLLRATHAAVEKLAGEIVASAP